MQCDEECSNYDSCISACPLETCDNTLYYSDLKSNCEQDTCVEGKLKLIKHFFANRSILDGNYSQPTSKRWRYLIRLPFILTTEVTSNFDKILYLHLYHSYQVLSLKYYITYIITDIKIMLRLFLNILTNKSR